jgi:hypothetical protein
MTDAKIRHYMYEEMSGEMFCTLFPNLSEKLVKLTNETECHNWFQFKTGLNVDSISFNPTGVCEPGGIYFTDIGNIPIWLEYGCYVMKYCRTVTLPPDCRVYIEGDKFKADKIILDERVEISELPNWLDKDYCLNAIRQSVRSLCYIHDINQDILLKSFTHGKIAFRYLLARGLQLTEKDRLYFNIPLDWMG